MKKKNLYILLILIIVVVLIIVFSGSKTGDKEFNGNNAVEEGAEAVEEVKSLTKEDVPKDIKVPELNEEEVDENVAVPLTVAKAGPTTEAMFRRFEIIAENNKFVPSEIIVNKGDVVHIDFTAMDKTYDITFPDYSMKQTAEKGEKKFLEFQALAPGKFLYYCELCGGLEGTTKGYIIIVPKESTE